MSSIEENIRAALACRDTAVREPGREWRSVQYRAHVVLADGLANAKRFREAQESYLAAIALDAARIDAVAQLTVFIMLLGTCDANVGATTKCISVIICVRVRSTTRRRAGGSNDAPQPLVQALQSLQAATNARAYLTLALVQRQLGACLRDRDMRGFRPKRRADAWL